ncbi:murein L,D-transpeptidase [Mesorhizobium sediminum]|nr:murein L,D-transpeptidase [Mesorhizobium sediminum]
MLGAGALAGCQTDFLPDVASKANAPIPAKLLAEIARKNMTVGSPVLLRVFKVEAELEVWKQDRKGRFALLKTYPICKWSGDLGPKISEGDRQTPEGFYDITPGQMNPNSEYYLSFNLGFPNAFDRAHRRTGTHLMVHGDCSSQGCYAMTDAQILEIFALGREAFKGGQRSFQVQAYPFRMTPANLARYRDSQHMAFWRMLKEGNDYFEVTRRQPKVDVCDKRYVFNAVAPGVMRRRRTSTRAVHAQPTKYPRRSHAPFRPSNASTTCSSSSSSRRVRRRRPPRAAAMAACTLTGSTNYAPARSSTRTATSSCWSRKTEPPDDLQLLLRPAVHREMTVKALPGTMFGCEVCRINRTDFPKSLRRNLKLLVQCRMSLGDILEGMIVFGLLRGA